MSYVNKRTSPSVTVLMAIDKLADGPIHLVNKQGQVQCNCALSPTKMLLIDSSLLMPSAIKRLCSKSKQVYMTLEKAHNHEQ